MYIPLVLMVLVSVLCLNFYSAEGAKGLKCMSCHNVVSKSEPDCGGQKRRCRRRSYVCRTSVRLVDGEMVWNKGCKKPASQQSPFCSSDNTKCEYYCGTGGCNQGQGSDLIHMLGTSTTTTSTTTTTTTTSTTPPHPPPGGSTTDPCACTNFFLGDTPTAQRSNSGSQGKPPCEMEIVEIPGFQNAVHYTQFRWTNGIIPYTTTGFTSDEVDLIEQGVAYVNDNTCLRIVPWTTENNYVEIYNGAGCSSKVGMVGDYLTDTPGGMQDMSLHNGGGTTCLTNGIIAHEFLHAAGFFHEQVRPDRDNYVCVNRTNLTQEKFDRNFGIQTESLTLNTDYTYPSIMHYEGYSFALDGDYPTLYPVGCDQADMDSFGNDQLHPVDIQRVARLYDGISDNCDYY